MSELAEVRAMAGKLRAAIADLPRQGVTHADPVDAPGLLRLLSALYATGRQDLPLGRLLEGHVDAVQIVARYGDAAQVAALHEAIAHGGAMLGVWNAAMPGEPIMIDGDRLTGGKSYASGAGVLTHALVTQDTAEGQALLLLPLGQAAPEIDRDWWHVTGMRRSETHRVRWNAAPITAADRIGDPGDYVREPWFSGGALRFVAVHAGGIAALFDHTRDHLVRTGRAADPFQSARLAELYGLAQAAADMVRGTASRWFDEADDVRLPRVAATRLTVADLAMRAMAVAQDAVGLQGLFVTHPLATVLTDLAVYLRQPAPDAQRLRVGGAAGGGLLTPGL